MAAKTLLKKFSLGCGGLFVLFIILGIAGAFDTPPEESVKHIPYEDVTKANAGMDIQILIDPQYANSEDLLLLGRQLAKEKANEDYVFISIFSDRRAVDLRSKVLADTANSEENSFYDKHYVGQYNKNDSQNFEVYTAQLNGLDVEENDLGDDIRYEAKDLR